MVDYDENGNSITQFLKKYNDLKSIFSEFKNSIKSEISENDQFSILINNETETDITIQFIDREFNVEFSIFRRDERNFLGKFVFSELLRHTDGEKIQIDQAFFDGLGNVKKTPSARYAEISIKQPGSSMCLLKYWLVKFIENKIEKDEPA